MPDLNTLQIKAARWLDAEHTKLVITTCFGIGNWPLNSDVGRLVVRRGVPIEPFYEIISSRRVGGKLLARVVGRENEEIELPAALWPDL